MQQHVKRMLQELEDLEGKIKRGTMAYDNPPFGMDTKGRELLGEQLEFMRKYAEKLKERIAYEEN